MAGSRGAQTDLPRSEPAAAPCPGNVPGAAAAPPGPAGPGATIEQQRHLAGEVSPTAAAPRGRAGPDRDGQGWAETGRDVQGWAVQDRSRQRFPCEPQNTGPGAHREGASRSRFDAPGQRPSGAGRGESRVRSDSLWTLRSTGKYKLVHVPLVHSRTRTRPPEPCPGTPALADALRLSRGTCAVQPKPLCFERSEHLTSLKMLPKCALRTKSWFLEAR